jgi:hypothetical protein
MKPLLHHALEPDIPARPRLRPLWTSWVLLALVVATGLAVAYGFWSSSKAYVPERELVR